MKRTLELIDQLIQMATEQEAVIKQLNLAQNRANLTVGEGSLLFHLKQLKELVCDEYCQLTSTLPTEVKIGNQTYQVAYGKLNETMLMGTGTVPPFNDGELLPFVAP